VILNGDAESKFHFAGKSVCRFQQQGEWLSSSVADLCLNVIRFVRLILGFCESD
jgi:hypothetical protein